MSKKYKNKQLANMLPDELHEILGSSYVEKLVDNSFEVEDDIVEYEEIDEFDGEVDEVVSIGGKTQSFISLDNFNDDFAPKYGVDLRIITDPTGVEDVISDNVVSLKLKNSPQQTRKMIENYKKEMPYMRTFLSRKDSLGSILSDISGLTIPKKERNQKLVSHSRTNSDDSNSSNESNLHYITSSGPHEYSDFSKLIFGLQTSDGNSMKPIITPYLQKLKNKLDYSSDELDNQSDSFSERKDKFYPFFSPRFLLSNYDKIIHGKVNLALNDVIPHRSVIHVGPLFTLLKANLYENDSDIILKIYNPQEKYKIDGKQILRKEISLYTTLFKPYEGRYFTKQGNDQWCALPILDDNVYKHIHQILNPENEVTSIEIIGMAYKVPHGIKVHLLEHQRKYLRSCSFHELLSICLNILYSCNLLYLETRTVLCNLSTYNIFFDSNTKLIFFHDFINSIQLKERELFVFNENSIDNNIRFALDKIFAAPEVRKNSVGSSISLRSDIYSIGVIFFSLFRDFYSTTDNVGEETKQFESSEIIYEQESFINDLKFFKENGIFPKLSNGVSLPLQLKNIIRSMICDNPQDRPSTYSIIIKEIEFVMKLEHDITNLINEHQKPSTIKLSNLRDSINDIDNDEKDDLKLDDNISIQRVDLKNIEHLVQRVVKYVDDVIVDTPTFVQQQLEFKKHEFWKERDMYLSQIDELEQKILSMEIEHKNVVDKLSSELKDAIERISVFNRPLEPISLDLSGLDLEVHPISEEDRRIYNLVQYELWKRGCQFLENLADKPRIKEKMNFLMKTPTIKELLTKYYNSLKEIDEMERNNQKFIDIADESKKAIKTYEETINQLLDEKNNLLKKNEELEIFKENTESLNFELHIMKKENLDSLSKIDNLKEKLKILENLNESNLSTSNEISQHQLQLQSLNDQISQLKFSLASTEEMCNHYRFEIHKIMEEKLKIQEEHRQLHELYFTQHENSKSNLDIEKILDITKIKLASEMKKTKNLESQIKEQELKYDSTITQHHKELNVLQLHIRELEKKINEHEKIETKLMKKIESQTNTSEDSLVDSNFKKLSLKTNKDSRNLTPQKTKANDKKDSKNSSFKRRYSISSSQNSNPTSPKSTNQITTKDISIQSDFTSQEVASLQKRIQMVDEVLMKGKQQIQEILKQQQESAKEITETKNLNKDLNEKNSSLEKENIDLNTQLQKAKKIIQYFDYKLKVMDKKVEEKEKELMDQKQLLGSQYLSTRIESFIPPESSGVLHPIYYTPITETHPNPFPNNANTSTYIPPLNILTLNNSQHSPINSKTSKDEKSMNKDNSQSSKKVSLKVNTVRNNTSPRNNIEISSSPIFELPNIKQVVSQENSGNDSIGSITPQSPIPNSSSFDKITKKELTIVKDRGRSSSFKSPVLTKLFERFKKPRSNSISNKATPNTPNSDALSLEVQSVNSREGSPQPFKESNSYYPNSNEKANGSNIGLYAPISHVSYPAYYAPGSIDPNAIIPFGSTIQSSQGLQTGFPVPASYVSWNSIIQSRDNNEDA